MTNEHYDGKGSAKSAGSATSVSAKGQRKSKRSSSKEKSSRSKRSSRNQNNGEIDWKSIDAWTIAEGKKGASTTKNADEIIQPIDLQAHGQYQQ